MKTSYIYAMVDPRTNTAFYVGVAQRPLRRFREHTRYRVKNQRLKERLAELTNADLRPKLRILETIETGSRSERETYWIIWHIKQGIELCNIDGIYHKGKRLELDAIKNRGNWATLSVSIHKEQMQQIEQLSEWQDKDKSEVVRRLLDTALSISHPNRSPGDYLRRTEA